ncbi:MAG TPA: hypothetical protein VHB02_04950 [Acidimicrobiales bacterium]|nr:hypothetical protein [Acidimicrobiales bacterium]
MLSLTPERLVYLVAQVGLLPHRHDLPQLVTDQQAEGLGQLVPHQALVTDIDGLEERLIEQSSDVWRSLPVDAPAVRQQG